MASSYSNLHPVDEILTSLVVEAVPSDSQLIADKVIETITVPDRSGTLLIEESRNFMGAAGLDLERAPGASRVGLSSFDRTSTTFKAKIYALEKSIAMEDIFDSQYPGSEEQRVARRVSKAMKLAKEKRCADVLFNSSLFETSSPGTKFDASGADPLTFLHELKDTVFEKAHGINPDSLVLGRDVFRALARNPEIRGYVTVGANPNGIASGNRILSDDAVMQVLRDVLGIPNVHVGQARHETAVPGATSSEAYIWERETIFMGILKPANNEIAVQRSGGVKTQPVAALNFQFGNMIAGQYDSIDKTRRYVYAEEVQTFKDIDSTLGHVLTDCLT